MPEANAPITPLTYVARFRLSMGALVATGSSVLSTFRQPAGATQAAGETLETDPSTAPANRGPSGRVRRLLDRATADGACVAVLAVGLDHLQHVDDVYGPAVVDDVLRRVAATVRYSVREGDVVARLGDEELCVLALLSAEDGVDGLARRIRSSVECDASAWGMTVSVGGVQVRPGRWGSGPGEDPLERIWTLLDRADVLLHEAQDSGHNLAQVVVAV